MCGGRFIAILFCISLPTLQFSLAMNKNPPPEAKLYPNFSRHCPSGDTDCTFKSNESPSTPLYFKCRENVCFCLRSSEAPADQLVWPVQWRTDEKCLVGKGGPCGEDQGLSVQCPENLSCVQGRCRYSNEVNSGRPNQSCNDDMDCQAGLKCQEPAQRMEIRIKRCLSL